MANKAFIYVNKFINDYIKDPDVNFNVYNDSDNLFLWRFTFYPPHICLYSDNFYNGIIEFPMDFPTNPPIIKFTTPIFHPNIYNDGRICISILHPPGIDIYNYEHECERWLPVHTLSSIFLSILNLILEPNLDSPANVDASILYRDNLKEFKKKIRLLDNN